MRAITIIAFEFSELDEEHQVTAIEETKARFNTAANPNEALRLMEIYELEFTENGHIIEENKQ